MTFKDVLLSGFVGYLCRTRLSGGASVAVVYGLGLVLCMLTYFLGSLNFAIIISKRFYHTDVRSYGSGNAGTTNMLRVFTKKAAGLTLLGDAVKAVVSCAIGYCLMGYVGACISGFFCILGHIFPIYYHFKGGKGVVTMGFMMLMLDPVTFVILLGVFLLLVLGTRLVSLASVMTALLYPLVLYRVQGPGVPVIFAFLTAVLVVFMHRQNLARISKGQESRLDLSKLFGRKKADPVIENSEDSETAEAFEESEVSEAVETSEAAKTPDPSHTKKTSVSRAKQKRRREQVRQEKRREHD